MEIGITEIPRLIQVFFVIFPYTVRTYHSKEKKFVVRCRDLPDACQAFSVDLFRATFVSHGATPVCQITVIEANNRGQVHTVRHFSRGAA